ncbi:hypothetical protein [Bdellovibrio sp. HCB209]|uniref:hypothetical protein n=1 Tax=Bdellovibrio sp. HCB209 TaxID=3394354 RepID=UPI0039B5397F
MCNKLVLCMGLLFVVHVRAQSVSTPNATTSIPENTTPTIVPQFGIKQIIRSHKLVVIETNITTPYPNGKIFLATFPDGDQCSLILKETNASLLTLDSTSCDKPERLTTKTPVEPSLVSVPGQQVNGSSTAAVEAAAFNDTAGESRQKYGSWSLNAYYSSAKEFLFDGATYSGTSGTGKGEISFDSGGALGGGFNVLIMNPNSWGFSAGGFIESSREIKSVTVKGANGTAYGNATGIKPKIGFVGAEFNALYRWEKVYLPFGANLTAPYYSDIPLYMEIQGGLGLQLGMGFLISENAVVEVLVKTIGMRAKYSDGSDTLDYGYGTLTGATVGGKIIF